ncbi:DUF6487 domain-containing protein, partial [Dysosmobacter welbionis]
CRRGSHAHRRYLPDAGRRLFVRNQSGRNSHSRNFRRQLPRRRGGAGCQQFRRLQGWLRRGEKSRRFPLCWSERRVRRGGRDCPGWEQNQLPDVECG